MDCFKYFHRTEGCDLCVVPQRNLRAPCRLRSATELLAFQWHQVCEGKNTGAWAAEARCAELEKATTISDMEDEFKHQSHFRSYMDSPPSIGSIVHECLRGCGMPRVECRQSKALTDAASSARCQNPLKHMLTGCGML